MVWVSEGSRDDSHLDEEALEAAQRPGCAMAGNAADRDDGGDVGQNVTDRRVNDEPVDRLSECREEGEGEQDEEAADQRDGRGGAGHALEDELLGWSHPGGW